MAIQRRERQKQYYRIQIFQQKNGQYKSVVWEAYGYELKPEYLEKQLKVIVTSLNSGKTEKDLQQEQQIRQKRSSQSSKQAGSEVQPNFDQKKISQFEVANRRSPISKVKLGNPKIKLKSPQQRPQTTNLSSQGLLNQGKETKTVINQMQKRGDNLRKHKSQNSFLNTLNEKKIEYQEKLHQVRKQKKKIQLQQMEISLKNKNRKQLHLFQQLVDLEATCTRVMSSYLSFLFENQDILEFIQQKDVQELLEQTRQVRRRIEKMEQIWERGEREVATLERRIRIRKRNI